MASLNSQAERSYLAGLRARFSLSEQLKMDLADQVADNQLEALEDYLAFAGGSVLARPFPAPPLLVAAFNRTRGRARPVDLSTVTRAAELAGVRRRPRLRAA